MNRNISFIPLDNYNLSNLLQRYCDLLKSHYNDHYVLIINSCNNKLISYHYSTTINQIEFGHPICEFISNRIKELPNSGLYSGIITTSFLYRILKLRDEDLIINNFEILSNLDKINSKVFKYLDDVKEKKDLRGDLLVCIVKDMLIKFSLDKEFSNILAVSTVKALLNTIDESTQRLGHISIKAIEGSDFSEAYNGILYKLESFWIPKEIKQSIEPLNVLLFTEPLDILSNKSHDTFINEKIFIDSIIKANITVVACQKVIDKKIIFLLKRHNIFALERLGEETACALAHLSKAFPISDYSQIKWTELNKHTGQISTLKFISINNEKYLLLINNAIPVVTLFVSHRTFDALDQLKALLKECIHMVFTIFKCPYFLPYNFDVDLAKKLRECKEKDCLLEKLMTLFAESLEEASPVTVLQENFNKEIERDGPSSLIS